MRVGYSLPNKLLNSYEGYHSEISFHVELSEKREGRPDVRMTASFIVTSSEKGYYNVDYISNDENIGNLTMMDLVGN